jgi:nitrite reductase (NO-forming)
MAGTMSPTTTPKDRPLRKAYEVGGTKPSLAMTSAASLGLVLTLLAAALAGCVSPMPHMPGGSAEPGANEVRMVNSKFSPATLTIRVGESVRWVNDDAMGHTVTPTDSAKWGTTGSGDEPSQWLGQGGTWSHTFDRVGTYDYYCAPHAFKNSAGQWQGMIGRIVVVAGDASNPENDVPSRTVVPNPVAPARTRIALTAEETIAQVDEGAAYEFWTFSGTVPGPMLRVRQGDRVNLSLENPIASRYAHSIDLHAVTGPGGGAAATQTPPGAKTSFEFAALHPGVYVYHCATPHVPSHIANGMYGLIVVEPTAGYPPVDKEFYVVQGELYTEQDAGAQGLLGFSPQRLLDEDPSFVLFNGHAKALTADGALTAQVGQSVRIFFGVGGGLPSSFHVIGEIFDRVLPDGNTPVGENRQTVLVPAAGAYIVEFRLDYPGTYVLVDHTLSRTFDKGALGLLIVTGPKDPRVYDG